MRMALKQGQETAQALWDWMLWARRSRLEPSVKLQRSIVKHWDAIAAAADHGLSNGLVESMNTKIRLITRTAFDFKDANALIALALALALAMLSPDPPA
ncbi:transposase [Streptomyces atratus]